MQKGTLTESSSRKPRRRRVSTKSFYEVPVIWVETAKLAVFRAHNERGFEEKEQWRYLYLDENEPATLAVWQEDGVLRASLIDGNHRLTLALEEMITQVAVRVVGYQSQEDGLFYHNEFGPASVVESAAVERALWNF